MMKYFFGLLVIMLPYQFTFAYEEIAELESAYFAGGCFWCMQSAFDQVDGVVKTEVGYTGGVAENPTYEEVGSGKTGHAESIKVTYDPTKVNYQTLLGVFWHNIDPTVKDGQFCDVGSQYRSAIFYKNKEQKQLALKSLDDLVSSGRFTNIYTEIEPLKVFYPAEEYHQNFYKKNPIRYKAYKFLCGRERRLSEIWGN